jgi:hypothetical protein
MTVSAETIKEWNSYREHGDFKKIAEGNGIHAETVKLAIKNGKMSENVFHAINNFYIARKHRIKEAQSRL